jgi:hypothetical protein
VLAIKAWRYVVYGVAITGADIGLNDRAGTYNKQKISEKRGLKESLSNPVSSNRTILVIR